MTRGYDLAVEMQVHNPVIEELTSPDGFRAFYAEALPKVYGYFYARCDGDKSTAEDLTQETLLAASMEIKRGGLIEQPLPWIVGFPVTSYWITFAKRESRN